MIASNLDKSYYSALTSTLTIELSTSIFNWKAQILKFVVNNNWNQIVVLRTNDFAIWLKALSKNDILHRKANTIGRFINTFANT